MIKEKFEVSRTSNHPPSKHIQKRLDLFKQKATMFARSLLRTTRTVRTQHSFSTRTTATFFSNGNNLTSTPQPLTAAISNNLRPRYFSAEEAVKEIKLPHTNDPTAPLDPEVEKVVEAVCSLNLLQISQMTTELKIRLNLPDVAPQMMMGGGGGGGGAAPAAGGEAAAPAEEKTDFDVKLTGFDDKAKIKVIKEVRALTGLGLKEAKAAVEAVPNTIGKGMKKEDAEAWVEKIKAVGGHVELE